MLDPLPLTTRQQNIFEVITRYVRATGEPCSASYLARRFEIHHSRAQEYLFILHRKGWLMGPTSPARPRRWLPKRRNSPAKAATPQESRDSEPPAT